MSLRFPAWPLLLAFFALCLGGCASVRGPAPPPVPALVFKLAPVTLGAELAMEQRMVVQLLARPEMQAPALEVALEVDATAVRLAVLRLGQTVARIHWDGQVLEQKLAPGWPTVVSAERVLSDLQLVWWPLAPLQQALPPGWTLTQTPQQRELRYAEVLVSSVKIQPNRTIQLIQHLQGYRVDLDTEGVVPDYAPVAGTGTVKDAQ